MGYVRTRRRGINGVVPKETDSPNNKLRPFGYWVDERGIRHKGVIQRNNR